LYSEVSVVKRFSLIDTVIRAAQVTALVAVVAIAAVAAPSQPPSRIQVSWAPTEQLSETNNNPPNRGWLRPDQWMQSLGDRLRKSADRILAPGQQLRVHVDDISLAGRLEPVYRPGQQDMRVMKEIYSPWMNLHFVLLAADGATIREGDAKLGDPSFLRRSVAGDPTDPLRFDKRMIDEWLRTEFGPKRS
jgi:Protein of unknown function (DUF3016)